MLFEDQFYVDFMLGIFLYYLIFIMIYVFLYKMVFKEFLMGVLFFCIENVLYYYLGLVVDESFIIFCDIICIRKMWVLKKCKIGKVVVLKKNKVLIFFSDDFLQEYIFGCLYVDCFEI